MDIGDEQDVQIDAQNVYVNNAWTPRAVFWNTFGTVIGGLASVAALGVSVIAIIIALSQ